MMIMMMIMIMIIIIINQIMYPEIEICARGG
jgi:hypothetical protein